MKLQKTFLSRPPQKHAFQTSLLGLSLLMLVFALDQQGQLGLPASISASPAQVFGHHEYWRAWTTALLHADLKHLAANSLFFTGLAFLLSGYFGLWAFPVLSFVAGGLINLVTLRFYPAETILVGASGIVYFMAAFWLTLYFFIERGSSKLRRFVNAAALSLALLFPQMFEPQVSYLAHAVGFAMGIPFGMGYFAARRGWIRGQEVWVSRGPKVVQDPYEYHEFDPADFGWEPLAQAAQAVEVESVVEVTRPAAAVHPDRCARCG